jgi:hypothetical protein
VDNSKILAAIDEQIKNLQEAKRLLGGSSTPAVTQIRNAGGKKTMSAAARKKISLALKARWAKRKKAA